MYYQRLEKKCAITVEPVQESIDEWVQTIIEKARISKEFQEQCTPGYYNLEGAVNQLPQNNNLWRRSN
jgi:hypothetical protein